MHDATIDIGLGIAAEFLAVDFQVITAGEFRLDAQLFQSFDNWS